MLAILTAGTATAQGFVTNGEFNDFKAYHFAYQIPSVMCNCENVFGFGI